MSTIDRQRIAAVKALEAMGYRFRDDTWFAADATGGSPEADAMHALLVQRADQLEGCIEGSAEEREYSSIVSAIVTYEEKRWPEGQDAGRQGLAAPRSQILSWGRFARGGQASPHQLTWWERRTDPHRAKGCELWYWFEPNGAPTATL